MINIIYFSHHKTAIMHALNSQKISYNEITVVLKGSLEYKVNSETKMVNAGEVIFIKENSFRERKKIENSDYFSINFTFDNELEKIFNKNEIEKYGIIKKSNFNIDIISKLNKSVLYSFLLLEEIVNNYNVYDKRLSLIALTILQELENQKNLKNEKITIKEIKNYIKNNLNKKLTLEKISKNVFLSPIYCDMLFKKETGISLISYVTNEKINLAKTALIENIKLKDVAKSIGESDYNYFCRKFKLNTGYTPKEYRNIFYKKNNKNNL